MTNTKKEILNLLLNSKKTVGTLSKELGVRESAVRAHLEGLTGAGLVTSSFERRGRGRPKKLYWLTQLGLESFPRRYDEFSDLLLEKILEEDGSQRLKEYMRNVAKAIAQRKLGDAKASGIFQNAADTLDEMGFETSSTQTREGFVVTSTNCIIRKLALKYREHICEDFHTSLVAELTRVKHVELTKCMAYGDDRCVHVVAAASNQ
jgi:DeoR family suf operon transcriptional repressor